MRIGILTGGGDVPGLNPCIKMLVNRAIDEGHEPIGFRRGWNGLLSYNVDDPASDAACTLKLDKVVVRKIDRSGGTFLHTSRTNPSKVKPSQAPAFLLPQGGQDDNQLLDFTPHVLKVLEHLKIDVLIPIGGEDTLGYGTRVHREGFPVICIPKTMDNDVYGTDICIGFSTCITRSVEYINQMRTSVGSHERIGVVELFGRRSGATSLVSGFLAGADRVLISEVPFDMEKLGGLLMKDRAANPSHYAMMTVSEGAKELAGKVVERGKEDAFGHRKLGGVGMMIAEELKAVTGANTMYQQLGYLIRSGPPDVMDLMLAANYANLAMELVGQRKFGHMVALQKGCYTYVPADLASQPPREVDVDAFYDKDEYRPKIRTSLGMPAFLY